tara:strand:- start:10327 stop:10497 length:171 start_codon:yes stop_codon:yes gene_type:complete
MVDPNSATWQAIEKFIAEQREDCVNYLIADRDSDQQRGALLMLERLEGLAEANPET